VRDFVGDRTKLAAASVSGGKKRFGLAASLRRRVEDHADPRAITLIPEMPVMVDVVDSQACRYGSEQDG
jgi:hypothetical protein